MKQFGFLEEFQATGKRGSPKKPKVVPSDDLRYAQVVKTRKNGYPLQIQGRIFQPEKYATILSYSCKV